MLILKRTWWCCYVLASMAPVAPVVPRVESKGLEAHWVLHRLDLGRLSMAVSPLALSPPGAPPLFRALGQPVLTCGLCSCSPLPLDVQAASSLVSFCLCTDVPAEKTSLTPWVSNVTPLKHSSSFPLALLFSIKLTSTGHLLHHTQWQAELNQASHIVQRSLFLALMHSRPPPRKWIKWRRKGSIRTYYLEWALIGFLFLHSHA